MLAARVSLLNRYDVMLFLSSALLIGGLIQILLGFFSVGWIFFRMENTLYCWLTLGVKCVKAALREYRAKKLICQLFVLGLVVCMLALCTGKVKDFWIGTHLRVVRAFFSLVLFSNGICIWFGPDGPVLVDCPLVGL